MSEQPKRPGRPEEACEAVVELLTDAGFERVMVFREPDDESAGPVRPDEEQT